MSRKDRIQASHSAESPTIEVRLEFTHPTALEVGLGGTFNDWNAGGTPMVREPGGKWLKVLALPPGTYQYAFVVDGEWMPDPTAEATAPDPSGRVNSVLKVHKKR